MADRPEVPPLRLEARRAEESPAASGPASPIERDANILRALEEANAGMEESRAPGAGERPESPPCDYATSFFVSHSTTISLATGDAATFNSDPDMINAFRDTVALSLKSGVRKEDIYDIQAEDVTASDSGKDRVRRHRHLSRNSNTIEIKYKVRAKSESASEALENEITSLDGEAFKASLIQTMERNNISQDKLEISATENVRISDSATVVEVAANSKTPASTAADGTPGNNVKVDDASVMMFFIGFLSSMVIMLVVGGAIYRRNGRKKMPTHGDDAVTNEGLPSANVDAWENNPLQKELVKQNDGGSGASSIQLTRRVPFYDASQNLDKTAAKALHSLAATAELRIPMQNQLPDGWSKHMDDNTGRPFFVHTESGVTQWNPPVAEELAAQQLGVLTQDALDKRISSRVRNLETMQKTMQGIRKTRRITPSSPSRAGAVA
eukprot:g633.t1